MDRHLVRACPIVYFLSSEDLCRLRPYTYIRSTTLLIVLTIYPPVIMVLQGKSHIIYRDIVRLYNKCASSLLVISSIICDPDIFYLFSLFLARADGQSFRTTKIASFLSLPIAPWSEFIHLALSLSLSTSRSINV